MFSSQRKPVPGSAPTSPQRWRSRQGGGPRGRRRRPACTRTRLPRRPTRARRGWRSRPDPGHQAVDRLPPPAGTSTGAASTCRSVWRWVPPGGSRAKCRCTCPPAAVEPGDLTGRVVPDPVAVALRRRAPAVAAVDVDRFGQAAVTDRPSPIHAEVPLGVVGVRRGQVAAVVGRVEERLPRRRPVRARPGSRTGSATSDAEVVVVRGAASAVVRPYRTAARPPPPGPSRSRPSRTSSFSVTLYAFPQLHAHPFPLCSLAVCQSFGSPVCGGCDSGCGGA